MNTPSDLKSTPALLSALSALPKGCLEKPVLAMFDYDGTLAPIVKDFNDARLSEAQLALLAQVAQQSDVQLAIVSGRSVAQLMDFIPSLIGLPVYLAGSHGGELYDLKTGAFRLQPTPEDAAMASQIKEYLQEKGVLDLPNISLEDKTHTLVLHYFGASETDAARAREVLTLALQSTPALKERFTYRDGKMRFEIVPNNCRKGLAVERLELETAHRFDQFNLLYIGDDVSDLDAMQAVQALAGYSLYVGVPPEETGEHPEISAHLPNIQAVYEVLRRLC